MKFVRIYDEDEKMKPHILATTAEKRCMYIIVGSIVTACYLNGLGGEFVHDDVPAVVCNKDVVANTRTLFTTFVDDFWGTPMTDPRSHKSYRPLTTLTFRVNYLLAGLESYWFHATNIMLHFIATILFTQVCIKVVGIACHFATLAGIMFAVHPIHTEAVTGIVGRADVLACICFLVSLLAYHKSSDLRWAKEKLFYIKRILISFITFTTIIIVRLILLRGSLPKFTRGDNPTAFHPSLQVRFLTFSYIASFNFWLLLCPSHLSHDWQMGSIPLITNLLDYRNLVTVLIFTIIIAIFVYSITTTWTLRSSSKNSGLSLIFGLIILIVPFLPGSNFISTAGFVLAERVLYIPSMGFILLVVQGMQNIWQNCGRHRQTLISCILGLLIVHGLQCVSRNKDWLSRESLLRAGVRTLPQNAKMHYNYANFMRDSGMFDLAKSHYHTAIRLWPTYASAHNNIGTLIKNGDDAEKHFLMAIRFNQGHLNAHYNLGLLYRKQNRTTEAKQMLHKCILISPNFTLGYVELLRLIESRNSQKVGALLRTIVRQSQEAEHAILYANYLNKQGNIILALKYYNIGLSNGKAKLEAFVGSAKILRVFGYKSLLFQLTTRYHLMQRTKREGNALQTNVYLQRWHLSYELGKYATEYSLNHWTIDDAGGTNSVNLHRAGADILTDNVRIMILDKQQRHINNGHKNITIVTKNCLEGR